MNNSEKMEENFLIDVVSDFILVFISITGTFIGFDSLPQQETLIATISTINSVSFLDVIIKIMTIFSLIISSVAGVIPIIKFLNRNKK